MHFYDVTLAPGAADRIPAQGNFAKLVTAPSGSVELASDYSEPVPCMPGQGFRLFGGNRFRDVRVKNLAAVTQTIIVFISDGIEFIDTRVTGTVSVVDSNYSDVIAGVALSVNYAAAAGGVSVFNTAILRNPNNSGYNLVLDEWVASSSVAGSFQMARNTAADPAVSQTILTKRADGTVDTTFTMFAGTSATTIGTTDVGPRIETQSFSGGVVKNAPKLPWVIPPNVGISVYHSAANADIAVLLHMRKVKQ